MKIIGNIPSPEELKAELGMTKEYIEIKKSRDAKVEAILKGEDDKLLLIVGPCSADNEEAVCEYVTRLAALQEKVLEKIVIIPRIYTNKPRTNGVGYKGMLHQPNPEKAPNLFEGLLAIRRLQLRAIGESHLTAADEMLYPENYSYFDDILSYHAIGARSVENQLHRLVASGVTEPVGMKNPTGGDLSVMLNAIKAAQSSHSFIYRQSEVETEGNPLSHAVLRGYLNKHGENKPNYHYEDLRLTLDLYNKSELSYPSVIIDANHANSGKRFAEQPRIVKEVMHSRAYDPELKKLIKGFMIESYLEEGTQQIGDHIYGKSITDPCLGWPATERLILELADMQ